MKVGRCLSALLLIALFAAELSLSTTSISGEAPSLLSPAIAPQGLSAPEDPTIVRGRPVDVHFDVLREMASAESQPIRLDLFDDASLLAVFDRKESGWGGAQIWTGYVAGAQQSEITLAFKDEVMSGNIRADGLFYQIRYTESGLHFVYEIDQQAFPEDAEPLVPDGLPSEPEAGAAGDMLAQDSCTDIDVMVVYTDDARAAAGGATAMNELIDIAISETNTGYANSGISQRMDLVYTAEVSYDETSFNWDTTLNRLTGKTDGYMDEVHTLRDTYKADAVVLIVNNTAYCGIAWVMRTLSASFESSAFSVVSRSCATGYYSLAHETGHNFGSMHDRANSSFPGVFDYSYGYQAPDGTFRTVMAYAEGCPGSCPRINYWSNPDVYYGGQPTGVIYTASNSADNHLSLNNTACTVANWRDAPEYRTYLPFVTIENSVENY